VCFLEYSMFLASQPKQSQHAHNAAEYFHNHKYQPDMPHEIRKHLTLGQRAADVVTKFCGTWTFILSLFGFIFLWAAFNMYGWLRAWDPWPFILLNLILSCLAAVQAPIILMSQNREAERDRKRTDYDYRINRKSEREIAAIQKELAHIKYILHQIYYKK